MCRQVSSWVGDHQRIPAVDCFCFLTLLSTENRRDEVTIHAINFVALIYLPPTLVAVRLLDLYGRATVWPELVVLVNELFRSPSVASRILWILRTTSGVSFSHWTLFLV